MLFRSPDDFLLVFHNFVLFFYLCLNPSNLNFLLICLYLYQTLQVRDVTLLNSYLSFLAVDDLSQSVDFAIQPILLALVVGESAHQGFNRFLPRRLQFTYDLLCDTRSISQE